MSDNAWGNYKSGGWDASSWNASSWDSWEGGYSKQKNEGDWGDYSGGGWGGGGGRAGSSSGQAWWENNLSSWADKIDTDIKWSDIDLVKINKDFWKLHPDVAARSYDEVNRLRIEMDVEILDGDSADVPSPSMTFEEAAFPDWLQGPLKDKFQVPTPIQKQIWPLALQGRDLIGIAETGSGKTLAFILPMMIHIVAQDELKAGEGPVGVVLCPTRELAIQTDEVIREYSGPSGVKSVAIHGGADPTKQGYSLEEKNDVVVATPGRFIQLLNDKWTNLNRVTYVVVDEADEMLARDFGDQIRLILSQVRPDRQMLMFSATWPIAVQQLAKEHCTASNSEGREPVTIRIGGDKLTACRNIDQKVLVVSDADKLPKLMQAVTKSGCHKRGNEHKCLIFVRSKDSVDEVVWRLQSENFEVEGIHGGKKQTERDWVIQEFKRGQLSCVVSTDVLGRGHDIPRVRFVINYEPPRCIEDYVHRVGRTGRAGKNGFSLTFLTNKDYQFADPLLAVLRETDQKIEPELEKLAAMAQGGDSKEAWGSWGEEGEGSWENYQSSSAREAG
eukprot:TRINITY_DN23784_c0_g1_i1.p1 TRINITY_DN23784_c0_g1~~TRINITY_DN23784_c0_g1_i1.p1  ORF type:complete len:558 (+),score=112.19 TRINITY_DN23784_c0_g1_i1:48-1721(+)